MKWFKFYGQDYLSDPKMLSLGAGSRSCWITLLSYSSVNDNGMITFLSEDQLMYQAGLEPNGDEWKKTKGVLERLEKLGMIHLDNGMITIKNWEKRQETNLTSYERVKRYREKKQDDNAKITLEEKRIDKKRIDKKQYGEFKNVLLSTEEYASLCSTLTEPIVQTLIAELDEYIESKGVKYKSHRATIQSWARRRINDHAKDIIKSKTKVAFV